MSTCSNMNVPWVANIFRIACEKLLRKRAPPRVCRVDSIKLPRLNGAMPYRMCAEPPNSNMLR